MHDRIIASIGSDVDDFGFAGGASLGVLDAVSLGWVVGAKLAGADDDFYVGGLVQTFGFAGCEAQNDAFDRDAGVGSSDVAGGGVVGAGCGGFDVREVLTPVREE